MHAHAATSRTKKLISVLIDQLQMIRVEDCICVRGNKSFIRYNFVTLSHCYISDHKDFINERCVLIKS